jgi:hypothetical protein
LNNTLAVFDLSSSAVLDEILVCRLVLTLFPWRHVPLSWAITCSRECLYHKRHQFDQASPTLTN